LEFVEHSIGVEVGEHCSRFHLGHREVCQVAAIYHSIPEDEKQYTVIPAGYYGETGALKLYGYPEADTQTNGVGQFKPLGNK
jgi:hypothetical protein